ncbi:MAG: hypothetical protein IKH85_07605 [Methanobrevibacter sp.]|uniref:hypothetical protein n=1 Tax=Methanobrevibacter sp. TaxID=66852 RepID=UPI0025F5F22B|nr:hypothetical protein [Methanobrevibacter sp.]MBR6993924.1 hypothetical protein [Methanobrevibacter sp.]
MSSWMSLSSLQHNVMAMMKNNIMQINVNMSLPALVYIKAMSNISLYRRYDYKIVNGNVKVISLPL